MPFPGLLKRGVALAARRGRRAANSDIAAADTLRRAVVNLNSHPVNWSEEKGKKETKKSCKNCHGVADLLSVYPGLLFFAFHFLCPNWCVVERYG